MSHTIASASAYNTLMTDIGNELTESLNRSGTALWTAPQNAGHQRLVFLAAPEAPTDAVTKEYVDAMGFSSKLAAIADLDWVEDSLLWFTSTTEVGCAAITDYGRGLINCDDASEGRTQLGLGDLATQSSINDGNWSGADLAVANGGTGGSSASDARNNLGIVAYDLYSGSTTTNTSFPIGSYLLVNPGATTPSLNSTVALTLAASNEVFEIGGAGAAASGTWRARGVIGGSLLCQRTA